MNVRSIRIAALFVIFCLAPSAYAAPLDKQAQFFMSLEDIPLMAGLEEIPAETLSFDKPEGRIIESYARLNGVSRAQVAAYYAQSLLQFGWGKAKANTYFRGQEYLEISFETQGKETYLKILIRPSL